MIWSSTIGRLGAGRIAPSTRTSGGDADRQREVGASGVDDGLQGRGERCVNFHAGDRNRSKLPAWALAILRSAVVPVRWMVMRPLGSARRSAGLLVAASVVVIDQVTKVAATHGPSRTLMPAHNPAYALGVVDRSGAGVDRRLGGRACVRSS